MAIVDKYISHITPLGSPDTYKLKAYLLKNGRTFKVKLNSANASTAFDGSTNITDIGVSGILGTVNGGTGNDSFTKDTLIYANTATKLASYTSTKGGTKKLWYLNAGVPTDSTETVGATDKPVFLSSGTITESTSNIGSGIIPIYMASGQIKASTSTVGGGEQPVYLNSGTITKTTYYLKSNIEDGSVNQLAYYSAARTIDYTPKIYYINSLASTAEEPINMQGLRIVGSAVGNDSSSKKTTISGTTGLLSYGDGGPQIQFSTSEKLDDRTTSGAQSGALIFTDHDAAATGASWHFVSNQGDWNVISKRFHARTGISIGTSLPNTSYTLYTRGIANFNIASDNAYGINGHRLNAIFEGTTNASILIATPTTNHAYGIAVNQNGNMYIGYRNNGSYTSHTGDVYSLILNKNVSFYPSSTDATNLGTTDYFWKTGYINNIYLGNKAGTANAGIYLRGSQDNPLDRIMIEFLVNTSDGYGHGIKIGNGGVTVIGAGESARSLSVSASSEAMYVLSDGPINIEAGADAIANRKGVQVTTGGHLVPIMAEVAHPHAQNLGAAANNWYDIFARNHTLYANNAWYGDFHISVLGTTDTPGVTLLRIGNNVATGTANNSQGKIRLYAANANYTEILSQGNGSRTFYLPNYAGTMYAIHAADNGTIGNTTTPVYIAANGRATAGYPYLRYINSTDVTTYSVDELGKTASIAYIRATDANAPVSGHMVYLNAGIGHMGTPFQIGIHDSDNLYIYKRWYSSSAWSAWTKMRAGYADTAGAFSSNATVTLTGDTTGTSAGSTKSWSVPTVTSALTIKGGRVTTADSAHTAADYSKMYLRIATGSMTTNKPKFSIEGETAAVHDGHILEFHWDNSGAYNEQLALSNSRPAISVRAQPNGTWSAWTPVLTSINTKWVAWGAGTTAGPTAKLNIGGTTITSAAIPSASTGASGIVTTGAQSFAGIKTFTNPETINTTGNGAAINFKFSNAPSANAIYGQNWINFTNNGGRFYWREWGGTADGRTAGYEQYCLPACDAGRTTTVTYDIITTKNMSSLITGVKSTAAGTATNKCYILGQRAAGAGTVYIATENTSGSANKTGIYFQGSTGVLHGAAWNDYAEFRQLKENKMYAITVEPGRVVYENGDDTLSISNERLMRGCSIVSDTYGFGIGESEKAQLPIAVSGRVLAYPYENKEEFKNHIGWPVCSGPNGTVSIMTEEEEMKYPSRIIGIISAVPDYEVWHGGVDVVVDRRVWIKVR